MEWGRIYLLGCHFCHRRVRGLAGPMGQVYVSVCVVGGVPGGRGGFLVFVGMYQGLLVVE